MDAVLISLLILFIVVLAGTVHTLRQFDKDCDSMFGEVSDKENGNATTDNRP